MNASAEGRAETGTGAYTDSPFVKGRGVRNSGKLKLTGPDVRRRVVHKTAGEVSLNTADKIVILCMSTLRDDTKGMVLLK